MKNPYAKFFAVLLLLLVKSFAPVTYAQGWLWGKAATVTGCDAYPVATDPTGNVYCAGLRLPIFGVGSINFGSGVATAASPGSYQSVWVKYNNSGTPLWADGTISGDTWINSIATDASGNLILFGSFSSATMQIGSFTLTNSYPAGTGQYYLAKVSPTGTVLWVTKDGNMSTYNTLFGPYMLCAGGVATDNAGNIYISGSFDRASTTIGPYTLTNSGAAGTFDMFVAKYSPAGAVVWASPAGGNESDYSLGLAVSTSGNVYVCGGFESSSMTIGSSVLANPFPKPIAFIAKFSPTGAPVWGQAAGTSNGSFAVGLTADNYDNVYMTGGFNGAAVSFGGATVTRAYPAAAPSLACYLVKYTAADVVSWSKTIGSASAAGGTWGWSIALAPCGQVWVSGNYDHDVDIDGHTLVATPGWTDPVFVAGYYLSGGLAGYSGLGSGGDDQTGIACDAQGNVFLCSDYEANPFSIGADVMPPLSGIESFYLGKFGAISLPDTTYMHQDTTVVCGTDSITLTAPAGYGGYHWSDGSGGSTLRVATSAPHDYWVFCHSCGDTTLADTFHVKTIPVTTYGHTDTTICSLLSGITLHAPAGYTTRIWSTGDTALAAVVGGTGTYWVKSTYLCNEFIDTFHVMPLAPEVSVSARDTLVCSGSTVTLTAQAGYTAYTWSTGAVTSSVTVSSGGAYWVKCVINCTVHIDTTYIANKPLPEVWLGNDTAICNTRSIVLSSPQSSGTYVWNTGSTSASIVVATAGLYVLTVTENGCKASDSILVTQVSDLIFHLPPDTVLCSGDQYILGSGSMPLTWSTGATGSAITVSDSGTYWASATNECGTVTDTIHVDFDDCNLHFPSGFTPNGDGRNDIARVSGSLRFYKNFSLNIYNRWGQLVFYTEDIYSGWDGVFNGVKQEIGAYFYMIRYTLEGKKEMLKGDLTLIR